MRWIGNIPIYKIHTGTLPPRMAHRRKERAAIDTVNDGLTVARRILKLTSIECVDEFGLIWLQYAPPIKLLSDSNKRKPYPLSWTEQTQLFEAPPGHLADIALFAAPARAKYHCRECRSYFPHRFTAICRRRYRNSEGYGLEVVEVHHGGITQRKLSRTNNISQATAQQMKRKLPRLMKLIEQLMACPLRALAKT